MRHLDRNIDKYNESITSAIDWFIEVLEQDISLKSVKESKLKRACQSKDYAYKGIVAIMSKNNLGEKIKERIIDALDVAWNELASVVHNKYKLSGFEDDDDSEGIDPDVSTSVCDAKQFAEQLMRNISDSIDSLEANENVLEEKAKLNKNPLNNLRVS